jgi:hypothetical protein
MGIDTGLIAQTFKPVATTFNQWSGRRESNPHH